MPYLTGLADWCRAAAAPFGVQVVEWPGWQTRGRSGGKPYESGRPWCVMWHHTASSDQTLEDYHCCQSDNAPVCNLDIKSDGTIVVIAAGPTNTNGKGSGTRNTSKGTVPVDSMNSYALGIEFYNNGVGGAWPQIQIDVGFAVVIEIQKRLGLQPTDLFTHEGYAPDRKIDPATAAAVQGPWQPRSKNSSGSWNDDDLRAECGRRTAGYVPPPQPEPGPEPEPGDDWMANLPTLSNGDSGDYVERMQHLLAAAGYMNPANTANYDGVWGSGTDGAKARFDGDHGLGGSDTSCGPKSWESLMTGRVW